MNTQDLRTLIDTEPLNAGRTDAERLAWLKDSVTVWGDVTWQSLSLWASRHDGIAKLKTATSDADLNIRRAADYVYLVLQAGQSLQLSSSEVRALVVNLVSGAVFTVAEKDDLLTFSQSSVSRYESEGLPSMDDNSWLSHIAEARAL